MHLTIIINDDNTFDYSCDLESIPLETRKAIAKELTHIPNASAQFFLDFQDLWNEYAKRNKWRLVKRLNTDVKARLMKARKDYPDFSDWETIMKGLEADPFFSGKKGDYQTKPLTLFYKNRYFEFYDAGEALKDAPVKPTKSALVTDLKNILAGI